MKSPKGFGKSYFSLSAILAFSVVSIQSADAKSLESKSDMALPKEKSSEIIISKKVEYNEVDAPFASEIYNEKEIKNSHSKNLYDFLNTQTSITSLPSYGNPYSQKIDLRGYGLANGYENVVITVDGRRLNNIDMTPQYLSNIPMQKIKRVEILKGSGSVEYGDGASAGAINIITKDLTGAYLKSYIASHDTKFGSFGFGYKKDKFYIEGYIDKTESNGDKVVANDGTRNKNDNANKSFKVKFYPIDGLTLFLGKSFSKTNVIYPNALTLTQYENDPKTIPNPSWGSLYNKQYIKDDVLRYGVDYTVNDTYSFNFTGNSEDKVSKYSTWGSNYDYNSYNGKVNYERDNFKAAFGTEYFLGKRENTNITKKDNLGYFLSGDLKSGFQNFSFGARRERVKYIHKDNTKDLKQSDYLNAYELGYNYKLTKNSSLFANYNHSFQAPDVDRFFSYNFMTASYDFNGFIKPMKVDTYNIGYNNIGYPNKLKLTLFYANVKDEIYYDAINYKNTNLDKTKKYGIELYEKYNIHYNLFVSLNYSYTDTKIKKNSSNPSIAGNEIPGVSKHNVKLSIGYNPDYKTTLLLSHIYKSKAYAMSDFDKSFGKMDSYNTTNLSLNYGFEKFNIFAKVDNIFDKKNALFSDSGTSLGVYPVNYERTFTIGVSAKF